MRVTQQDPQDAKASQDSKAPEPDWKKRRRLDAVFGDTRLDSTSDDRDSSEPSGTSEEWLKRQVPPHHG